MPATTGFKRPPDDLVSLRIAFDMIGRHLFGPLWTSDMTAVVRLGRGTGTPDQQVRGAEAMKALRQCVHNGWLPLVYFVGDRRVRYFENPCGPAVRAVYPQPVDGQEGQVELSDGGIHPCMVDVSGLGRVLRIKFVMPLAKRRGRPPRYKELDETLDQYFIDNPLSTPNGIVIKALGGLLDEACIPGKTTLHERINAARDRARDSSLSGI